MTDLCIENLRVGLGRADILHDISFAAAPGEMIGLIGPNGAGKSTLVRAIARLLPRRDGRVLIGGRDIDELPARDLARQLAYLAQGHVVNWPITVGRLVGLGRLAHRPRFGPPAAADAEAVERAMARAGVSAFRARPVTALSGGERARVMLARALAVEAPVLMADEPAASLDPHHQLQVMEMLRAVAQGGGLVICVLHDLTLAARFCSRLILLREGALEADGPPETVLSATHLARSYEIEAHRGHHRSELYVLPWTRMLH